ncbi:V-type ATP synthase subunit A [Actinomadura macra]|uniref:V-type ATP synthase subunit A n=1 Tax=Actinomadura macra TaxID=46164 RepID=UPI0008313767|nr:V-type ATP synthase subunit A [Actinomadura macra]
MGHEVTRVSGPLVELSGVKGAAMGDVVEVGAHFLPGEIVALDGDVATVQAYEYTGGLAPGQAGRGTGRALSAPLGPHLLGGVYDGLLRPLTGAGVWLDPARHPPVAEDGRAVEFWPVRRPRPYAERLDGGVPLHTGQRVVDLLFPVPLGGTVAVPGGFGTGKTMLLQQVAKWCDADVIVYVGCGERGNEMADVLAELAALDDPRTGGRLADRTVVIANTSNMPMMAREAGVYSGVTVAEYFRDQGRHAVVIADSTSRWAEALREFASRGGELPGEEGFPAALPSALAAFYERAGRVRTLDGAEGSVTIIGAVSPPGGDMTEPVTAYTERFVRARWSLDKDLAYSRHYPAVSWSGSFARDTAALARHHAAAGDPGWAGRRARTASLLAESDRLAALAELVGSSTLPGHERMVLLAGRLLREGVLQQSALSPRDAFCTPERGAALTEAVLAVVDRCQELVGRGVPAGAVEEQDFAPIVRAREDAATAADIGARREAMLNRLGELP